MAEYFLYYAGMNQDNTVEQIGLAISKDGKNFERVNKDGLIIPIDKNLSWKETYVSNMTVLSWKDELLMYYHATGGFGTNSGKTSIALATSRNGVDWECMNTPLLTWKDMREIDTEQTPTSRVDLGSPAVIYDQEKFKMWFTYGHISHPGNSIYYAESENGRNWTIQDKKILSGNLFGPFYLYYPQVIKVNDGYEMLFTLRNMFNGTDGIFKMKSPDGLNWENLVQLLPVTYDGFVLKPREIVNINLQSWKFHRAKEIAHRTYFRLFHGGKNYYGYSHPHLLKEEGRTLLYYHNDNARGGGGMFGKGRYMDIGSCEIVNNRLVNHKKILERAQHKSAWDSFFVADPFVLKL